MGIGKDYVGGKQPSIVLEDSDIKDSGLIRETEGLLDWEPGQGLIVGTWTKGIDNRYYLWLEKSVDAMCDERLKWWIERHEELDRQFQESISGLNTSSRHREHNLSPKREVILDPETKQFKML